MMRVGDRIPAFVHLFFRTLYLLEVFLNHVLALILVHGLDEKELEFLSGELVVSGKGRVQKRIAQKVFGNEFFRIPIFPFCWKRRQNRGKGPFLI